ncbi:MAG: hypothetical protein K8I03_14640 [Ignavibacteria bacterium]|nr:hypothetical protein [Ignavibacteria bacterium]
MKYMPEMILFSAADGGGQGGGGGRDENITISKDEHTALTGKVDSLEKESARSKLLEAENTKKLNELKAEISKITTERDGLRVKFESLQSSVKKSYLDQLSDEHKNIAGQLPTIEGLAEYVKLNAKQPPAGTDSGKPGAGYKDYTSVKWDDMSYDEKEDVRKKRPEMWKKLYKEKFGRNP